MLAELRPGELLDQLLKGADAARQRYESLFSAHALGSAYAELYRGGGAAA